MNRYFGILVAVVGLSVVGSVPESARGDDKDPMPILDKAIKALGGEEKLAKGTTFLVKSKGNVTINGNEAPVKLATTTQGLDRQQTEFEVEFNGDSLKGVMVLNGKKGWRKFGENIMDLDDEGLATARQGLYLMVVPTMILPLKGKDFKLELVPEEKVSGKPADVIKVTGPDGKLFTLYIDKETSLPTKLIAKVQGMQGEEFVQETTYSNYKDFDGIKRATKTESLRDGTLFSKQEVTEFKVIDKPAADLFDEPK